jgi:hypothetical protein
MLLRLNQALQNCYAALIALIFSLVNLRVVLNAVIKSFLSRLLCGLIMFKYALEKPPYLKKTHEKSV